MRKFNFLSFLIGIIAVGGVGAFALTSQYLKSDGTPDFQKLKSTYPENNNRLSAEMRDQLMDGLSKMQAQIPTTNGETIPAGAVMAFNLSSCPDGWSPFTEANDRFIMGSQDNLRRKGGTNNIKLTIDQLPPHRFHTITDQRDPSSYRPSDSREWAISSISEYQTNLVWNSTVEDTYYALRLRNVEADAGQTNTLGNWNSINIQNPYIKLLYCVKGTYNAPAPAPRPLPKKIDGVCSSSIGRCEAGTPTSTKTTKYRGQWGGISSSLTTRTCEGINGGDDKSCEYCENGYATDGIQCRTDVEFARP